MLNVFVSYCHADEWLKEELDRHCSAMKRSELINLWHDRKILPGANLDGEISEAAKTADIFLFLISSDFVNSSYCMDVEYKFALERHSLGEAVIVPIIVRKCDWDVLGLRDFNALPKDARAVATAASRREDTFHRDDQWVEVVQGIRAVVEDLKKKATPPNLAGDYIERIFLTSSIHHKAVDQLDERDIFVDPEIYHQNSKKTLNRLDELVAAVSDTQVAIIVGRDRAGKTLLSKFTQVKLDAGGSPNARIAGHEIRNADFDELVETTVKSQYQLSEFNKKKFGIVIDDFDACHLPDSVKERIVEKCVASYAFTIIFSYSNGPAVLFAKPDLPDPDIFNINQLSDPKLYTLVQKWKNVGRSEEASDDEILPIFERLQQVFNHADIEVYAASAVTFLTLLDNMTGSDLAVSSFAACYDAMITSRLIDYGMSPQAIDEFKNFISQVAFEVYKDNYNGRIPERIFEGCLSTFEEQYFSSAEKLRDAALTLFLRPSGDREYFFKEEYIWYFLCARYASKTVRKNEGEFRAFVDKCTRSIFQKKYANIVIYLSYFVEDEIVLESLLETVDGLFCKADGWVLSDSARGLMLDFDMAEPIAISSDSQVDGHRFELLEDRAKDVIANAEKVVAQYTLPFLDSEIGDSRLVEGFEDGDTIGADTYLLSVNALLRTHSVIGHILNARTGTYGAPVLLNCIERMVKASGRYARLNHAIATLLIYDKARAIKDLEIEGDEESIEDSYNKIKRIFAFWSVYLAQAGLARYLSSDHTVKALNRLVEEHEQIPDIDDGHVPFNFTSVLIIAKLYNSGVVPRKEIENAIEKFGPNSALFAILRAAVHVYSYYMPMKIREKQWVSSKLRMPIKRIEMARRKALEVGRVPAVHKLGKSK